MKKLLNVFIIDNDKTSSALFESYLIESGCQMTLKKYPSLNSAIPYIDNNSVNLFILDVEGHENSSLAEMETIEKSFKNCKFIITSHNLKTDFIIKCLRNSKKDFIQKPIPKNSFIAIVKEISEKMTSDQDFSGHGKVISVFSNKGGLGKTTISVNLAWQLAVNNPSSKIAIVDMNTLGDVTTFLDINPPYDLTFIIDKIYNGISALDIASVYENYNLFVFANSPYHEVQYNISAQNVLLLFNSLRKIFKYIIVDISSEINQSTKQIFQIADLILLITEANLPVLNNTKRCLDFFDKINLNQKTQLLLNRYSYDDDCSIHDVETVLCKNILTGLPNDWKTVMNSVNKGLTIGEYNPETDIYASYVELAQLVMKKLCH